MDHRGPEGVASEAAEEDGAEQGHAERATQLLRGAEQPGRAPATATGTAASTTLTSGMTSRARPAPATARPGTTGHGLPLTPTWRAATVTPRTPAAISNAPLARTRRP